MTKQTWTAIVLCVLTVAAIAAAAQAQHRGVESVETIEHYCVARGRNGRDGNGVGRYVAPNGFSIMKAETVATACKRCSIRPVAMKQPDFASLKQETGVDYSKVLAKYAESASTKANAPRILAVSAIVSGLRVVKGTSHAMVEHACHGESHRRITGNDNGWGKYNLRVVLRREPTATDYAKLMLELIEATERGNSQEFSAIIETLKNTN